MQSMRDWRKFDTMERVKKNRVMTFVSGVTTWSSKRTVLLVAVVVAAFAGSIVTSRVYADDIERADGERLITLYDRGVEQSFITTAATVEGALTEAGIAIDEKDRVEPALNEQLVADEYSVNVYRARPLVVVDGATRKKIMTASQSPEQIARDAEIVLYPEDLTAMQQTSDLLVDGAAEQFVVTRATVFSLTLYGEVVEARTQAATVGGMLKGKNITLGPNDRTSLPLDTTITAGMKLRVWREGKQTVTVEEEVDFEVEVISDANRPANYRETKTPGEKGKRSVTYEIVIQDGKEVARTEITSVVLAPAKKQVEIHGTKPEYLPYTGGGTKTEWLGASSIPQDQWGYADWLVQKESGWNPNAVNRSSGACGLAQALPCSKVPGDPHNPVNSLNWMNGYVKGRYGSWANAVAHSKAKGWY